MTLAAEPPLSAADRLAGAEATVAGVRALVCECAGTMEETLDVDLLEAGLRAGGVAVERRRAWCGRQGRARLIELMEGGDAAAGRLVLVGCSPDFAAPRFQALADRGLRLEVADIREGCAWVHGEGRPAVTGKALRIAEAVIRHPTLAGRPAAPSLRDGTVVVVGGGVAGIHAAVDLARMGHPVELLERRSFLGGRAASVGPVFPTGDCGLCLSTGGDAPGIRRCLHRNPAVDHPNLRIRRRTEVSSVEGGAGGFRLEVRTLPGMVGAECIDCGLCDQACPVPGAGGQGTAIAADPYDGRVLRSIDLDLCTFCGACAEVCPVDAIELRPSADVEVLRAGAVVLATGCEPAPGHLVSHLGSGRPGVLTQVELAERLDGWERERWGGGIPARHVVMIQCAGSRDQRRLPYCSRLCCMIALKHALRLRALFPQMRVTICFQELRTPGANDESWYLAARRAGVEFVRGSPAAVEPDGEGRLVVEVEDLATARMLRLRPDVAVLSTGLVPAADLGPLARHLGAALDGSGFVAPLDAKNRTSETTAEGVFVCGSASGPKTVSESVSDASAAAARVHDFLTSGARRSGFAAAVEPSRCIGCGACVDACPYAAIRLVERDPGAVRPEGVRREAPVALVTAGACRGCGICTAACPELAITHPLDDGTLLARMRLLAAGVEDSVIGFTCSECASAAFALSGRRRDRYPERVRLIELPCLGRISALHLVEAARLGAAGVFLAGCVEGRCQHRDGEESASRQAALAAGLVEQMGRTMPIELWHLCAVDHPGLGERLRRFCDRLEGAKPGAGAVPAAAMEEGGRLLPPGAP